MKTFALDTNCFIDAFNPGSPAFEPVTTILQVAETGLIRLAVSLHTLRELATREDSASALAKSLPLLRHFPIGNIDEQISIISDASGTFDDLRRNELLRRKLTSLAKAGTDIRDKGAYIDALCSSLDGFITSDRHLCADGPKGRINMEFATKIITPAELALQLPTIIQ